MLFDLTSLPPAVASLVQEGLKVRGFYQGTTKGVPGPATITAFQRYLATLESSAPTPRQSVTALVMRDRFVEILRSKIGVVERGGNNRGPEVQDFQKAASWLEGTGWAWCAAYVGWGFDRLAEEFILPFRTPEGAGAFWYEDWARGEKLPVFTNPAKTKIRKGDLIIFSYSHIEVATQDELPNGKFVSVGGNTSSGVANRDGDGVWEKTHTKGKVRSIIRPFQTA